MPLSSEIKFMQKLLSKISRGPWQYSIEADGIFNPDDMVFNGANGGAIATTYDYIFAATCRQFVPKLMARNQELVNLVAAYQELHKTIGAQINNLLSTQDSLKTVIARYESALGLNEGA